MSSPAKREKKGAHGTKWHGIDEGTSITLPSPPHRFAMGPFLSRFTGEDEKLISLTS